jgi:predicted DNA-binding antitoxin AbrB/MazE fold protein
MFLFATTLLMVLVATQTTYSAFPDVADRHTNFDAVKFVESEGIVNGYPDGTFKPLRNINRAEFTKIIIEAVHPGESLGSNCFPDVKEEWFAQYVCFAKQKGIINGYPDGTFKPGQSIAFSEAAKIIVSTFGYPTQVDGIWYKPYVEALSEKSAIPTSIAAFGKNIGRGEMAEMIYRLKASVDTKSSHTYRSLAGLESPKKAQVIVKEEPKDTKKENTIPVTGTVPEKVVNQASSIPVTGTVIQRETSSAAIPVTATVQ